MAGRRLEGLPHQPPDRRNQFRRIPGRFAFQPRHFPPGAVNDYRRRQAPRPQGPRRRAARVEPYRKLLQAQPLIEGLDLRPPAAIRRQRQHANTLGPNHRLQAVQRRHFGHTRWAPGRP